MNGHELETGPAPAQMIEPALERGDVGPGAAGALREQDEGAPLAHRVHDRLDLPLTPGGAGIVSLDEHGPGEPRDEAPHRVGAAPVIAGAYRAGKRSDRSRQRRPDEGRVHVARVITEVDALACLGPAAHPADRGAGEQPHGPGEDGRAQRAHRAPSAQRTRAVRRAIVIAEPAATITSPPTMALGGAPTADSTAAAMQARPITTIRWVLAMGPPNCCATPAAAPSTRT